MLTSLSLFAFSASCLSNSSISVSFHVGSYFLQASLNHHSSSIAPFPGVLARVLNSMFKKALLNH